MLFHSIQSASGVAPPRNPTSEPLSQPYRAPQRGRRRAGNAVTDVERPRFELPPDDDDETEESRSQADRLQYQLEDIPSGCRFEPPLFITRCDLFLTPKRTARIDQTSWRTCMECWLGSSRFLEASLRSLTQLQSVPDGSLPPPRGQHRYRRRPRQTNMCAMMANWGAVHTGGAQMRRPRHSQAYGGGKHKRSSTSDDERSKNYTLATLDEINNVNLMKEDQYPFLDPAKAFIPQRLPKKFHDCKVSGCEIVTINVSGMLFELRIGLLNKHPKTLLGNPAKRRKHFDKTRNEFFFDRHRQTFEAIFNYYKYGGRLRRPPQLTDEIFLDELDFYEIETERIDEYKLIEGYTEEKVELPADEKSRWLWMMFEYPETSTVAFIIAVISVIVTLVSIVLFCVETLPTFGESHCEPNDMPNFLEPFFLLETICNGWFTFEFFIRLIACPAKCKFFTNWMNWVDLAAIAPYYVTLTQMLMTMSCEEASSGSNLAFLRVIRLVRIFKLTKHSSGLQVLLLTFRASAEGLGLFLLALCVCMLMFSSAIYFADIGEEGTQMESIPDAFWWCIITMCTVGYGDKIPVGLWGKLVGSMCALAGVLTLAIPVPIITENFNKFYSHRSGKSGKIV